MQKVGRNDPCPCGSGQKFKKCCEPKMSQRKKIEAKVLSTEASPEPLQQAEKITGFFKRSVIPPSKPLVRSDEEKAP